MPALHNKRPRRLRVSENLRNLVRETHFSLSDLVQPIFIDESIVEPAPIAAMPGMVRWPENMLQQEVARLYALGIRALMPFGISSHKDDDGSDTWRDDGLVARMIRAIKRDCPQMVVIPDICFCEYTTHGHCGVLRDGHVCNEGTLRNLVKQSLVAARAGADMLAPSSMMDGQVRAIREALDLNGFENVAIMAHSAKFASAFYGPFRAAVDCAIEGDRKQYQLDCANGRQALLDAILDEEEGADILMVKPGMPYLDVLSQLRARTGVSLAAYQVSGEYAAIKLAAQAGALDEKSCVFESMVAFKRAGADVIVTYFAKSIAIWLAENKKDDL